MEQQLLSYYTVPLCFNRYIYLLFVILEIPITKRFPLGLFCLVIHTDCDTIDCVLLWSFHNSFGNPYVDSTEWSLLFSCQVRADLRKFVKPWINLFLTCLFDINFTIFQVSSAAVFAAYCQFWFCRHIAATWIHLVTPKDMRYETAFPYLPSSISLFFL